MDEKMNNAGTTPLLETNELTTSSFISLQEKKSDLIQLLKARKTTRILTMDKIVNVKSVAYKGVTHVGPRVELKGGLLTITSRRQGRGRVKIIVMRMEVDCSPGEAIPAGEVFEVTPVDPDLRLSPTLAFSTREEAETFVDDCLKMINAIADEIAHVSDSGADST